MMKDGGCPFFFKISLQAIKAAYMKQQGCKLRKLKKISSLRNEMLRESGSRDFQK